MYCLNTANVKICIFLSEFLQCLLIKAKIPNTVHVIMDNIYIRCFFLFLKSVFYRKRFR